MFNRWTKEFPEWLRATISFTVLVAIVVLMIMFPDIAIAVIVMMGTFMSLLIVALFIGMCVAVIRLILFG